MLVLGTFIRDVIRENQDAQNFRVFGPDETQVQPPDPRVRGHHPRCGTPRAPTGTSTWPTDGRVMDSMLSEHMCEGWLEGYLLTGRHGFFNSYEAFIRIVDSMFAQHAKWLKACNELPWRQDIASLNYILSSNVWQQDHNGFTHQDPGFLDHVANKKADVVRMYLPPDANCLLSCFDHCISQPELCQRHGDLQAPPAPVADHGAGGEALHPGHRHLAVGLQRPGCWSRTSVLACCGETPTLETLAAVTILRHYFPDLKIRVVNVVDLMTPAAGQPSTPTACRTRTTTLLFTEDKPILFAFHGYPSLIHELTYRRKNKNLHVRGYMEEGTITTPFDMRVLNNLDRFHLTMDVIHLLPQKLGNRGAFLVQQMQDKLVEHKQYIAELRRGSAGNPRLEVERRQGQLRLIPSRPMEDPSGPLPPSPAPLSSGAGEGFLLPPRSKAGPSLFLQSVL